MKKNNLLLGLIPVMFGFFVMGFVDVVGVTASHAQAEFGLTEQQSGYIPFAAFLWFLILSVPTAGLMNKIGRKNTVLMSMAITFVGMMIPYIQFNLTTCLLSIGMLGIGNTILQVSLNPLVSNVVSGKTLTSALTAGQVVKAVSSLLGPSIITLATHSFGGWQHVFTIYAGLTILSGLWLALSPIERETAQKSASMGATFALLKDKTILLLFLGIVAVVGVDVGINTAAPKLLMETLGLDPALQESADATGYASQVYFACRTAGALLGTILLVKFNPLKYFRINILIALVGMALMFVFSGGGSQEVSTLPILSMIGLVGFACSSVFPVIYGMALQAQPEKGNEISGLMITGVFGGAVIPPLMTYAAGQTGNQTGALIVLTFTVCYLIYCSFGIKTDKA